MEVMKMKMFDKSLVELKQRGGQYQRAAGQVFQAIGQTKIGDDPFTELKVTKHGESRIRKCIKYDLSQYCRLITIQDGGYIFLCFAGTHDACEAWLKSNKGLQVKVGDDMQPVATYESIDIIDGDKRIARPPGFTSKRLLTVLAEDLVNRLFDGLPYSVQRQLDQVTAYTSDDDLLERVTKIEDAKQRSAIFDVLVHLRADDKENAEKVIKVFLGELRSVEEAAEEAIPLIDSEDFKRIPVDTEHYRKLIEHFSQTTDYRDWMLFMHPDQDKFVTENYAGPAKLSGVSGSGKTCIVVKRSIDLAQKYPEDKILVLTLNRSLASLIEVLVDTAAEKDTRSRIEVMPFFRLCQNLLHEFEPHNGKLYDDKTWKSHEHIDEIWREYYRCELNNYDARVMQRVHDSLIARGIDAEDYIRQEFNWIRSAVAPENRKDYLQIERIGRSYPLDLRFRDDLLKGLEYWERKMRAVGVTDYLGVATALYRHLEQLKPLYRCILVDESQDFGTIELKIIRRLAAAAENDLFLCGDAAQQVSAKHQNLKSAGIEVPGARSKKLLRNYRNSREILRAAHHILVENLSEEMLDRRDFEVLDPKYASFSGPAPLILRANSIAEEMTYAVYYLRQELDALHQSLDEHSNAKACIAICGYSLHELTWFSQKIGLPVLDGSRGIDEGDLFISDLENTKGFEFQYICIVNCSADVIPYQGSPEKERFRDLSRFYVAMTRTRYQLIVSYSRCGSPFLKEVNEHFLEDDWASYLNMTTAQIPGIDAPDRLEILRSQDQEVINIGQMTAEQFLYTEHAIGLSPLLIEKMRSLITGENIFRRQVPIAWANLGEAAKDISTYASSRAAFGPEGYRRFKELVDSLGLSSKKPRKVDAKEMEW